MNITVNAEPRTVAARLTVSGLVRTLELPDRGIAVAVDGSVVPRSDWESSVIAPDARVDVVTALQGG